MEKFLSLLTNRYAIYLTVSATLYLFFTLNINKYKSELILTERSNPKVISYIDLDGDGNSEKVIFQQSPHHISVIVYIKGNIIDQWNFRGVSANISKPFFADYNCDGIKEIVVFTMQNKSIYMHCLDAMSRKIKIENKLVCKAYKSRGTYDFTIFPCTASDVNNDGYKEIFFSIYGSYSTRPRNMFAYYPKKDTVLVSPESCTLVINPLIYDLDDDQIPEFIGNAIALGNCGLERKYTDQYAWLMVFTPEMKFKFPPVRFDAYPATSQFIPFNTGKKKYILVLHFYRGTKNFPSFIALFNAKGQLVRKKNIETGGISTYSALFSKNNAYKKVFMAKKGEIYRIDSMLHISKAAKFENIAHAGNIQKMDIDCDGEDEFIFSGKSKKEIIIYRNDFSNPVILKFPENIEAYQMSIIKKMGALPQIFVDTDEYSYTFAYESTMLYKYRYVLLVIIYLWVMFLHFVIKKIKHYRELRIANAQKQILELQIKSIQNQMDPHFTFNIFASFNNLINEKNTERANYIFNKYTGLLKSSVLNANKVSIALQHELDFVESYLELEEFRYSGKFTFQLNINKNIDKQMPVPKMLLHLFVENAIKHGLKHIDTGGELKINAARNNGAVELIIKDNGIGRKKAEEYSGFSTGKGLDIMNQILEHYYKLNKINISYEIIDLYEKNRATGTEVRIKIPLTQ